MKIKWSWRVVIRSVATVAFIHIKIRKLFTFLGLPFINVTRIIYIMSDLFVTLHWEGNSSESSELDYISNLSILAMSQVGGAGQSLGWWPDYRGQENVLSSPTQTLSSTFLVV